MKPILRAERMKPVHSDIRGPLFVEAMKRQKQGIDVLKLNTGNPATFGFGLPDSIKNALMEHMQDGVGYCDFKGMPQARQAICDYETSKGIKGITPDDVFIGNGVSEVVSFALTPLLNDGDEVLVPSPSYSLWGNSVYLEDGKPVFYTCDEKANWYPDIQDIRSKITEKTKAIVIINPNNPTGYLYTRREMNQIRDLVKKYDLFLFSDEVYREFIYTGSPYISACHLEGIENNVVLIDSVSKRYSECGIRIGALITKNKEIRDAVMKFCQARLSPPLIGQIAAEASLDAPEEYSRETYDEYVERRKCLIDGLNRIPGVYSPIPMGAFYTVAKLPVDDSDKFCAWCLSDFEYEGQTVFMAPASGFYTTPGSGINEVRIAYVLKKEDLTRALFILQKALEVYPGRTE